MLEFAYRVKEGRLDYSIFWIPTLSMESMEQACNEIANLRELSHAADDGKDVRELVRQYLSSDAAGKWLLIIDNADDINMLFGGRLQAQGIADYLPQSGTGIILFTTRYRDVISPMT